MAESKNKVWVYVDHFKGKALPASWEVLGAGLEIAKNLGGGVSAIVFGQGIDDSWHTRLKSSAQMRSFAQMMGAWLIFVPSHMPAC
jgi:electron transfer flavoprotein alpha subunit